MIVFLEQVETTFYVAELVMMPSMVVRAPRMKPIIVPIPQI